VYEESVGKWQIKSEGYNTGDFEVVFVLSKADLYFAFHKDTPDSKLAPLQKALDQLKSDGTYTKISNRYLK
jgi:polar amino acid transport system substrate-binding protein